MCVKCTHECWETVLWNVECTMISYFGKSDKRTFFTWSYLLFFLTVRYTSQKIGDILFMKGEYWYRHLKRPIVNQG